MNTECVSQNLETSDGSSPGHILVLEDDVHIAEVIRDWFEDHAVTVTLAHRGVEALKHVAGIEFDAIICDMVMPQMPGDMFYIAVGKLKPHMSDRFVFITGCRDRPDVAHFLWEYCGPTFDKPLSLKALTDAVNQVAGREIACLGQLA